MNQRHKTRSQALYSWAITCLCEYDELHNVMLCLSATGGTVLGLHLTKHADHTSCGTDQMLLTHPPCLDSWTLMNCRIIVSPKDHCVAMSLRIIVSYVFRGIIVSLRIIVSYVCVIDILEQCLLGCVVIVIVIVVSSLCVVVVGSFLLSQRISRSHAATIYCRVSRYLLTLLVVIT